MVNRPPDRDPPPPGGFDPRFDPRSSSSPDPRRGPDPRFEGVGEPRFSPDPRFEDDRPRRGDPRLDRDPRGDRDPFEQEPDSFGRRSAPPPPRAGARGGGRSGRLSRSTMLLIALGLLLLIGAVAFALSLSRSGPGSDALEGSGDTDENSVAADDPEARCAAPATYDKMKRELFRQAAAARGADLNAFDRLSAYAVLRVSGPVLRDQDEELQRVSCSGTVTLDLPPGVQVVGGRRSLTANLGYSLQPAADGSGDVVTLTGAEPITAPLATLARIPSAQVPPAQAPDSTSASSASPPDADSSNPPVPEPGPPAPTPPGAPAPPEPAPPPPPSAVPAPERTTASPSFNCARARTRGERAVCASEELAALDRQMANRYFSAVRGANATQRVLLERTRGRFLAYRDRCTSNSCIAGAYRDRIREIGDIMADRWVPPR